MYVSTERYPVPSIRAWTSPRALRQAARVVAMNMIVSASMIVMLCCHEYYYYY